jgi:NTE family protein
MKGYRFIILVSLLLYLAGCASSGRVTNTPIDAPLATHERQITTGLGGQRRDDAFLYVAMSGGGTRAAAFSYGVLQELRDTTYTRDGKQERLLDEIDYISSVSGGSFTAAYYSLFGDRIFEDYETVFLRQDVQKTLIGSVLNPFNWLRALFTGFNRTETAIDYYDRNIFEGGTFNDVFAHDGPYLVINASDLGIGGRFTFTQERFNLLCSDLGPFKVARAVAASSAVPVLFAPVTLQNHDTCDYTIPDLLYVDVLNNDRNPRISAAIKDLNSYRDKSDRPYVHLVDGGVTDNLGIRSLYDRVELMGGAREVAKTLDHRPEYVILIIVNAATNPENPIDSSRDTPSTAQVMSAVSSTQIGGYTLESLSLLEESFYEWAAELSTPEQPVIPFFIKLDFESVANMKQRRFLNNMATSFSLPDDEVDTLIEAGRILLREAPDYQKLVRIIRE